MNHILIFCFLLSLFTFSASGELTDADYDKLRSMLKEQTNEIKQEIKQEINASEVRLKSHISQSFTKLADALDKNHDALDRSAERLTRILIAYIIFLVVLMVLAWGRLIKILWS